MVILWGWKHDPMEMFKLLKAAGNGLVRFRALDPETAEALVMFKDEAEGKQGNPTWGSLPGNPRFLMIFTYFYNLDDRSHRLRDRFSDVLRCRGPVSDFWLHFMDPGDTGAMSRTEFLNNLPKILGALIGWAGW